jgi:hypothetical protein
MKLVEDLHEIALRLSEFNMRDDELSLAEQKEREHLWNEWKLLRDEAKELGVYESKDFVGYLL